MPSLVFVFGWLEESPTQFVLGLLMQQAWSRVFLCIPSTLRDITFNEIFCMMLSKGFETWKAVTKYRHHYLHR